MCAVPAAASRSSTSPSGCCWVQWAPPSWVDHRSGPNTHPSDSVAKRMRWIVAGVDAAPPVAGGAGTRCHVLAASAVRRMTVHGGVAHGAEPRTKPSLAETNVTDTAEKPAGTVPDWLEVS